MLANVTVGGPASTGDVLTGCVEDVPTVMSTVAALRLDELGGEAMAASGTRPSADATGDVTSGALSAFVPPAGVPVTATAIVAVGTGDSVASVATLVVIGAGT